MVIIAVMVACSAFAHDGSRGGGGMFVGYQVPEYPGVDTVYPLSSNLGLSHVGGFGYGVNSRNEISGGFGYAISDADKSRGIKGGMAGFISGYRFFSQPLYFSLVSWTGFGGIYTGNAGTTPHQGYFCVSEEIDLELGLPVVDWFMPVVFAGYQVIGNIAPGQAFQGFFSYSPVVGFRIVWGKFR